MASVLGGLLFWQSQAAHAQLLDQFIDLDVPGLRAEPGVTVTSRQRPDYDYRGVRVGSVLVRPEVSEAFGYDDNVTGSPQARGSAVLLTRVNLQAASDLPRYGVTAGVTMDDFRYLDQPRQSLTNWTAALGGTYDLGRDTASLAYSHINLNQTARDLDTPLLDRPIAYRVDSVRAVYRTDFNRLSLRPELVVSQYDFDDGTVAGVPYPQKFRNRVVIAPGIVAAYELAPRRNAVLVVRNLTANYVTAPAGGPKRDFNDTSVLAGIDYDGGELWRYRVLAGYEIRNFSSAALKTIQAPVVEGTVIFTPTGLTTLTGTVARRIQDSAAETTTGFTETAVKLTLDHEYLRNVLFKLRGGVYFDDFNQNGGQQVLYTAGAGGTWLLNRNMRLAASYDYTARHSNTGMTGGLGAGNPSGSGYSENRFLLQLSFGL